MIKYSDASEEVISFNLDSFKKIIPKDSIAIDIGAAGGYFSLLFGECVGPGGRVISFEPNPHIFKTLKNNVKSNSHLNIDAYELACTKETKSYIFNYTDPSIYKNGINGGYFDELSLQEGIKNIHYHQIEVSGVNVNEFLNEKYSNDLEKIKFIKIDAEGYDKEIIKILSPIIRKSKPILMLEAFSSLDIEEVKDFYKTLISLDYLIYDASPHNEIDSIAGPLDESEFEYFLYNVMKGENFFCFHKDCIDSFNLPKTVPGKTAAIIFGRNDGYKEKERFVIHLSMMLDTFDEVVYVDWNSTDQSFLYEVLDSIPKTGKLKHFVITPEYAKMLTMEDEKAQACNSVLSFNIGIRRTDAEWIVLATTDIIPPSKETMDTFISKANKNSFYTFSRRDVEYDDIISNKEKLDEFRVQLDNTTVPRYFPAKVTPNDNYSIFNCCGDFQLASKNLWYKIRGYEEMMLYACFVDTNVQKKSVLYGFNLIPIYDIPLYHMSHRGMANDGTSPSKQYYNDPWEWVEFYNGEHLHGHQMYSRNADTWGFSNVEIEYEII